MPNKSVMSHTFSQVPKVQIQRSVFDRSHGYKTTLDPNNLIPILVDEALPGDTFSLRMTTFARLASLLHPIMDNMKADVFFFFVPYRLVWTHFVNFFGEQANPADSTSFLVPIATSPAGGYLNGSLQDYMGLPTQVAGIPHSNLHMRAYNLIWNQWFRDQNMQNSLVVDMGDGPDTVTNYTLQKRNKRHDYFTACLPWPQKNNTGVAVTVPIGGQATVKTQSTELFTGAQAGMKLRTSPAGGLLTANVALSSDSSGNVMNQAGGVAAAGNAAIYPTNLYADLSTATSSTINQLRQAFQIQKVYERDARGGTRYTELIQAHFGVTSPDARLQRAEYLGGGSAPININPIAQSCPSGTTGSTTPQGNLAAIGTSSHNGVGFTKSFTEHGMIIGLLEITADLNYQQGLNRMWSRSTRFDFYWPALAQIGEQGVLNQEIYAQGTAGAGADTGVFGYQERYAEYRYFPSIITGQFRSNFATPLDSWHLAQNFGSLPTLNSAFISENVPITRVIAVTTSPSFLLDCYFQMRCARPMPLYGVPGNIDRF